MNKPPTVIHWTIIFLLALVWGSSYILMKRGLEAFSWNEVGAMRIGIAAIILSPIMLVRIRELSRHNIGWLALVALLGNGLPPFLFALAQTHTESSVAAILNALTPMWTLLVGILLYRTRYAWLQITGILVAFAGSAALIWLRPVHVAANIDARYSWYVVLATIAYGLSVNTNQHKLLQMRAISIAAFSYGIMAIPTWLYLSTTDVLQRWHTQPKAHEAFLAILILAVVNTAMGQMLYNKLIKEVGVLLASAVTYLMPIVSVAWGVFDHENVGLLQILCLSCILVGVYLVSRFKLTVKN